MVNSKRARSGKPQIQPRGCTYIEPKGVSPGLKRVREAAETGRKSSFHQSVAPHNGTNAAGGV